MKSGKIFAGLEMLWEFAKCPENYQNVLENLQNALEKPQVSWILLEMVEGATKC